MGGRGTILMPSRLPSMGIQLLIVHIIMLYFSVIGY